LKINILGCGPAGIFAAHAAVEAGHDVTILSIPRKSHMRGAQYLHRPIPGLSPDEDAPFQIEYALRGTIDGYREKVYGDRDVDVSVDSLVGKHDAWDIRKAYDAGFDRYQHLIRDFTFSTDPDVPQMELPEADLTFSTIPAKLLCQDDACAWESEWIWSTDSVRGAHRSMYFNEDFDGTFQDNKVLCSGDPDDFWYRISIIDGWENTEWPLDKKPRVPEAAGRLWRVEKPIATDCHCAPDIRRLGRYGAWRKGVLADSAYYDAAAILVSAGEYSSVGEATA
jgi:hypothetical protein